MVGIGMLMILVGELSAAQYFRKKLFDSKWLQGVWMLMMPSGFIALLAGWFVTEIGRQPWLVHGVLTTAQAASQVPAGNIALSLAMYLTLYAALLSAYVSVVFYLAKKAVDGGHEASTDLKGIRHA